LFYVEELWPAEMDAYFKKYYGHRPVRAERQTEYLSTCFNAHTRQVRCSTQTDSVSKVIY